MAKCEVGANWREESRDGQRLTQRFQCLSRRTFSVPSGSGKGADDPIPPSPHFVMIRAGEPSIHRNSSWSCRFLPLQMSDRMLMATAPPFGQAFWTCSVASWETHRDAEQAAESGGAGPRCRFPGVPPAAGSGQGVGVILLHAG
jgi:hypothetical protein